MGSIISRKRKDGTLGFRGQIVIKRQGKVVHREMQTFDRKQAARAWIVQREAELAQPGALDQKEDPTFGEVIDRYIKENQGEMGDTKTQVLRTTKTYAIAQKRCSKITSQDMVAYAQELLAKPILPQTVQSYLSNLG